MAEFTTVFLSSTAKDLQPWRDAVYSALNKMDGVHCFRMEDFGAVDAAPVEVCRQKVAECEHFVGLIGEFNGSLPLGSPISYTQVEYEEAKRLGKPRLLFLTDGEFSVPSKVGREPDAAYQRQVAFRAQVESERTVVRFHDPHQLATLVVSSLGNHLRDLAKAERSKAPEGAAPLSGRSLAQGKGAVAASSGGIAAGLTLAQGAGAVAASSGGIAAGGNVNITHVYGQAPQAAVSSGPDEAALRRAYLLRLVQKLEHLVVSGVDPAVKDGQNDPRIKLRAIYTALRTGTLEGEPGRGPKKAEPFLEAAGERRSLSALELLNRESRLVLLGGPGGGKSTFVSFVALCLAGEGLGHKELNLRALNGAERVLAGDRADEEEWESEEEGPGPETDLPDRWRRGGLLPVWIVLRDFAARGKFPGKGERATARVLSDFLERELEEDFDLAGFAPLLKRELLAGRCLVLLDGLDEVPEADERREHIVQAVQAWTAGLGESRVLVTSRTYAYQNEAWKLQGFAEAVLEPFDRRQIGHFIGLWYGQMVSLGRCAKAEAETRSGQLREAVFGSERLLELARQPLLLTLTASLHAWRRGELPKRREALYRDAVELLLETWERRQRLSSRGEPLALQPSLAELLRVGADEVRRALNELAFEAHSRQADPAGTADLDGEQIVVRLLRLNPDAKVNAGYLLDYLRDRAGLLVERSPGVFTFPHRTFQEYLAACHLTQFSVPEDIADLARAEPGRWREVVLLAAAETGAVSNNVWQIAEALCPLEPEGAEIGEEDRWGALLAAQVVAESADRRWLEELEPGAGADPGAAKVGKAHLRRVEHLREWLDHLRWRLVDGMRTDRFATLERARAGKLLGELGDPRFDPKRWELPERSDLGFLEVPEGPFWMGSEPEEPDAFEDEQTRHEVVLPAFWLSRYPVTVAQFAAFVKASGHEPAGQDWKEGSPHQPVVGVSWFDALAYCGWLEKRLRGLAASAEGGGLGSPELREGLASGKLRATLPSEAEWEKAARGTTGLIYPWGAQFDARFANCAEAGLGERSVVGCFPSGAGPCGHEEMSGNVWEWTRSVKASYPYRADDGRENLEKAEGDLRVLRGGAFYNYRGVVRCAYRNWRDPDSRDDLIGFRVVLSPFPL